MANIYIVRRRYGHPIMAEINENVGFHKVVETIKKFGIFNVLIPTILQISPHHIMTDYGFGLVLGTNKTIILARGRHFCVF